jgi:hypothetical protein
VLPSVNVHWTVKFFIRRGFSEYKNYCYCVSVEEILEILHEVYVIGKIIEDVNVLGWSTPTEQAT